MSFDEDQRWETNYWYEPDVEETKQRLSNEDLNELKNDIGESEHVENEWQGILEVALQRKDEELYKNAMNEIKSLARREIGIDFQPDWAWSLLSFSPPEIEGKVLEPPTGGEHKGMLLAESGDTLGLYPKNNNLISDRQHIERWALNLDNLVSLGYQVPSVKYDRGEISFVDGKNLEEVSQDDEEICLLTMEFNGEMILRDKLESYLSSKVSDEKAEEITDYFDDKIDNSEIRNFYELEPGEDNYPVISGRKINGDNESPAFVSEEEHEKTEKPLLDIQLAMASGEFFTSTIYDYTRNKWNIAYVLPENWHSGRVEPESVWGDTEIYITDIGEYTKREYSDKEVTEELLREDPFLTEEQKMHFPVRSNQKKKR